MNITVTPTIASALCWLACGLVAAAANAQTGAQSGLSVPGGVSRPASSVSVAGAQTPWVKGYNSTARLIAGSEPAEGSSGGRRVLAGVEIRLNEGWKTYWRHPGDDGGLPPTFDWAGSRNLKAARVLYPMPERIKSLNGTSLGYAKAVVFPVVIEALDPAQPIELVLALDYGICREICVPAEAILKLTIPPGEIAMPGEIANSAARVPRPVEGAAAAQILRSAKAVLSGPAPALMFDIATGASGQRTDLFVEAPNGAYLPVPAKVGDAVSGVQRFHIDLKGVEDAAKLAGKPLRLTVSTPAGGHDLSWVVK